MPNNTEDVLESQFEVPVLITGERIVGLLHAMPDSQTFRIFSLVDEWREDIDFTLKSCNVFLNTLLQFHQEELEYYTKRNMEDAFLDADSVGPRYQDDMEVAQKAIELILKFQEEYKQLTD